ncbi:MAG TPA: phospholipase C, phosphocholine-specific [Lacisediminihabitans sp.]|uniref:phosphocholine-specific phospholipase C n=1 Tax=Lacisediminihabitans sp. TaxID=2787631 RepID=UPI002ED7B5D9
MSTSKPERGAPRVRLNAAPPLAPEQAYASSIRPGVSRRSLLLGGAAAIMAGVAAGSAFGPRQAAGAATRTAAAARTGTAADIKHVVILMQENRSFDHYYGTLPGVRGFGDKQVLEFPNGTTIFAQPDPSRPDGGVMLPYPLDSANHNAQNAGGLDHSWGGGHAAWNNGAWNHWVDAKSEQTMGYFTKDDIPYHHALASAFTICDQYHCSLNGPTTPNRLYQWSGTVNPAGDKGGPATDNPADYNPVYSWGTYGERLQAAGVSWRTYANDEVGDDGNHPYVGDYGDNPLWLFQQYHDALASGDPEVQKLAINGGLHDGWKPDSGQGLDVAHLLSEFGADCAAGTLPQVSYVVAPYGWCEHPSASPDYGAHYTNAVVQALFSNPDTWASTVLLINYDENDGYFDHVVPPMPEAGTPDEFVAGLPIGYGTRVPLTVVSPWSRGGWVNSQVSDHTSIIRFLETWTGVKDQNISDWRRTISGDLMSCFDFSVADVSIPTSDEVPGLDMTATLVAAADADQSKPSITIPAAGAQRMPVQEAGDAKHRSLPYRQNANVAVDRASGAVSLTMQNTGKQGVSHLVYPNIALPFQATPFTIAAGASAGYLWDAAATDGAYDFSVYGPDRFLRRFAGTVVSGTHTDVGLPSVTAAFTTGAKPALRLILTNDGDRTVRFELIANDFVDHRDEAYVTSGSATVDWPVDEWGYYDVIVTANTGTGFRYRFAGRIE